MDPMIVILIISCLLLGVTVAYAWVTLKAITMLKGVNHEMSNNAKYLINAVVAKHLGELGAFNTEAMATPEDKKDLTKLENDLAIHAQALMDRANTAHGGIPIN